MAHDDPRDRVRLSSPGKVLFPEAGLTKTDLAEHYLRVAEVMVPHVRDRPLTMLSFPKGVGHDGIFMKSMPKHFPDWVERVTVPKRGGTTTYVLANDAATLLLLAQQNSVTPHVWTSRADNPTKPDRVVWDLDPPDGTSFAVVRRTARALGERLRSLGLEPWAMTTGSRGIHVVAAIRRTHAFEAVGDFARAVAERLVDDHPDELSLEFHVDKRGGRIYVDTLRNRYAQTAVAAYAVRPRAAAPVAVPLAWDELDDDALRPDGWTITTLPDRLDAAGDPWAELSASAGSLATAARALRRA